VSVHDPATACSCCVGVHGLVPSASTNRPGLRELSWRVGTHSRFTATMLADISRQERLRELGRRTTDDFTIALIDAWAIALDILAFYQERILNESYLGTAVERTSLLELARLIGYELRPGLAAGVSLAFTLDSSPGSPREVVIRAGTAAQSVPAKEEVPQTFETSADLLARPRWNELRPRLTHPQIFDVTTRSFYLQGTSANLKPGDPMLLVTGNEGDAQTFLRILAVKLEPDQRRTYVTLEANPPAPVAYAAPSMFFGELQDISLPGLRDSVMTSTISSTDLGAALSMTGGSIDQLIASIQAARRQPAEAPTLGDPGLYALRAAVAAFGHNAPLYASTPRDWRPFSQGGWADEETAAFPNNWDEDGWPITRTSADVDRGDGRTILLDQEVKSVADNDWVVLVSRSQGAKTYQAESLSVESAADFGLSSKVTRVVLKAAPGGASTSGIDDYLMRETAIHTASELLELAELPIETLDANTSAIELEDIVPDLEPGRRIILIGERIGDFEGVPGVEELEIASVGQAGFTVIYLARPLAFSYKRSSVRIHANVAPATHGETRVEVLGSGDASVPFQTFFPKRPPITYVSSSQSPTGGLSTLEVRVNGVRWHQAPSFYPLAPTDRRFVVRLNDESKAEVQFGDGQRGSRLPTGLENVTAVYRSGLGAVGLVGAGRITLLPRKPLGVRAVTNPIAASGAQDAESRDNARVNAPVTVRTLERIVSLTDFEDFARTFSGIGKARADWVWAGSQRVIHVTVAGPEGADISPEVLENLIAAMRRAGVPHVPARVTPAERLYFTVAANLTVDADYESETVLAAAESALRAAFAFPEREFADRVASSEVIAILERVPGVTAVDLDSLVYEVTTGGNTADEYGLPALGARFDQAVRVILPAQLLMISPAPLDLRVRS
jgi:predicted phage baseplate assembly protein